MRIAIVGSGLAGLGSARLLQRQGHAVTVFEAGTRLGGHTHTVDVTLDGVTAPVDTTMAASAAPMTDRFLIESSGVPGRRSRRGGIPWQCYRRGPRSTSLLADGSDHRVARGAGIERAVPPRTVCSYYYYSPNNCQEHP